MPIDSSIYFQQQTPDILGGVERGLKMRDLLDQRKEQQGIKGAFKNNVTVGPDGKSTVNRQGLLSALSGIDPERSMEMEDRFRAQDAQKQKAQMENQMREVDLVARAAGSAKDQGSYEQALSF